MIKNKFYEAPEAELLLVKFEENFCVSGERNNVNNGYDDENDLGEI